MQESEISGGYHGCRQCGCSSRRKREGCRGKGVIWRGTAQTMSWFIAWERSVGLCLSFMSTICLCYQVSQRPSVLGCESDGTDVLKLTSWRQAKFASFPEVLVIHAKKFQLVNWVPAKLGTSESFSNYSTPLMFDSCRYPIDIAVLGRIGVWC